MAPLSLLCFCSIFSLSLVIGFVGWLVLGYKCGSKWFAGRFVGLIGSWVSAWFVGLWVSAWFVGIGVVVLWVLAWLFVGFSVGQFVWFLLSFAMVWFLIWSFFFFFFFFFLLRWFVVVIGGATMKVVEVVVVIVLVFVADVYYYFNELFILF